MVVLVSSVNLENLHALGVGEDMDQTIEWTQDRGRGRVAGHASRVGEHLQGRHRT